LGVLLLLCCVAALRVVLQVSRGDVETLVDAFPGQSIDFFGALRARVYDDKVRTARALCWELEGRAGISCVCVEPSKNGIVIIHETRHCEHVWGRGGGAAGVYRAPAVQ
jgi:hypothetical protein